MKKHISRNSNLGNFCKSASPQKRQTRRQKKNILIRFLQQFFTKQK